MSSSRMRAVQAPIIPIVGRWTRETPGTISLGQGLVSYGPPAEALEARSRRSARASDDHRYGPVEGQPELVDAIERKLAAENGIGVRPDSRVVVTAGGNMAFFNAVLAVDRSRRRGRLPGAVLLQPRDGHRHGRRAARCPCRRASGYQLDVDAIARADHAAHARGRHDLAEQPERRRLPRGRPARGERAVRRDAASTTSTTRSTSTSPTTAPTHVSPGSFAGAAAHTITLSSLSKAYGFAGWRIGYMVIPEALFDAVNKIQDTNLICPPTISQAAALAALRVGRAYCEPMVRQLADVRRMVLRRTPSARRPLRGARRSRRVLLPGPRAHVPMPVLTLVERLIREHRVAVIPGERFGLDGTVVRVSYGALDAASVGEGIGRFVEGVRRLAL